MRLRRPARLPVPHRNTAWREAEFCVLDLETTGLDLRRDEIVAYGAAIVARARIPCGRTAYGLVRPTRAISVPALTVHGLPATDLADAPTIDEAAGELIDLLTGRVLVAHAAWVEHAFLNRAPRPRGIALARASVDTAALLWPPGWNERQPIRVRRRCASCTPSPGATACADQRRGG